MKTVKRIIIAVLCLAIVGSGGYFGYNKYQKNKDDKRIVDVVPISLMAESYWADESTLDATVTSGSSQNIYLDNEKLVKSLKVSVGDEVKKGDVILTYDMTVVDLEIEQKKNQISLIEQQISEEERNLQKLKNLRPSELAPSDNYEDPDYSEPEEPEEPEGPEEPEKPLKLIDKLTDIGQADEQDEDGAFYFSCSEKTQVSVSFMGMLRATHRRAVLNVYDENENLRYIWDIDGDSVSDETMNSWCVSDGVTVEGGMISFDSVNFIAHGTFLIYTGMTDDEPDDIDMPDDDFVDDGLPDDGDEPDDSADDPDDKSEDYMYSRAELAKMIKTKEGEIKALRLDQRSAELDYKNSLKQKSDGQVVAERDGVVVRAGDESLEGSEDIAGESYDESSDMGEESGGTDTPYVTIQGKEGICIDIQVGEMNLEKFEVGTIVNCMSYDTGESFTAEVIEVNDEPIAYYSYMWNENPNSSTYRVTASVIEDTTLSVNNWVSVTMPQTEEASSGLYIPMQYVRKDGTKYYVMKADKKGKLKKQYIKSGKVIWGSFLEIKGGVSMDDMICFPYGKDVKEGVKTRESDEVLY